MDYNVKSKKEIEFKQLINKFLLNKKTFNEIKKSFELWILYTKCDSCTERNRCYLIPRKNCSHYRRD
jgi:hypothetical protein